MKEQEFVTVLQGKQVRELAKRLVTGNFTIEKQSLNRYKVTEGVNTPEQAYTLINRRSFVLLDKEIYRLQARENPLAAGIEKALDANKLEVSVRQTLIDAMNFKLIARTFSSAKVRLENVTTYLDNYIIRFALVESVSERTLTENEQAIAAMFQRANESTSASVPETPAQPETVDATAKAAETIPAK